jgi:hypothetical protein
MKLSCPFGSGVKSACLESVRTKNYELIIYEANRNVIILKMKLAF